MLFHQVISICIFAINTNFLLSLYTTHFAIFHTALNPFLTISFRCFDSIITLNALTLRISFQTPFYFYLLALSLCRRHKSFFANFAKTLRLVAPAVFYLVFRHFASHCTQVGVFAKTANIVITSSTVLISSACLHRTEKSHSQEKKFGLHYNQVLYSN